MKKRYIKPELEVYCYSPEKGYATTVALDKDFVLISGDDRTTLRNAEEVTEDTDMSDHWSTGLWD